MIDEINKIDLEKFTDPEVKSVLGVLLNIVEKQHQTIVELREDNQKLRDEINRLKGEDGKPKIKGKTPKKSKDISSEKERRIPKKKRSSSSKQLEIDTPKICNFTEEELSELPDDIRPHGYANFIVQDLIVERENILLKRMVLYSPSEKKTYVAPFPADHTGHFGPTLRSYILCLKNICNVTESKIVSLLDTIGVSISPASVSDILIKNHEVFHEEKHSIVEEALEGSLYHQIDDTSVRFDGKNYYCQVLCNELYTSFETTEKKDRITILKILLNGRELKYSLNEVTFTLLEKLNLGKKHFKKLQEKDCEGLTEREFLKVLDKIFSKLGPTVKKNIVDSAALAWYQTSGDHPVVDCLVSDDAKQFKLISENLALCWVHDGRHYKKLTPGLKINQKHVETFLTKYWKYYHKLRVYKNDPSQLKAQNLEKEFVILFTEKTGYTDLDDRIAKTYGKMKELLLVLKYPWLPLHNNQSELGARIITRIEDVSLHSVTEEGLRARDTFASIIDTAKKLGVNAFRYIYDRVSKKYEMKSLADIIRESFSFKYSNTATLV